MPVCSIARSVREILPAVAYPVDLTSHAGDGIGVFNGRCMERRGDLIVELADAPKTASLCHIATTILTSPQVSDGPK